VTAAEATEGAAKPFNPVSRTTAETAPALNRLKNRVHSSFALWRWDLGWASSLPLTIWTRCPSPAGTISCGVPNPRPWAAFETEYLPTSLHFHRLGTDGRPQEQYSMYSSEDPKTVRTR